MNQPIIDLLTQNNITFQERGEELVTHCLFSDCDADSKGTEAHLYINKVSGQYYCHKCGSKGGPKSLHEALGIVTTIVPESTTNMSKQAKSCHEKLPLNIRSWLENERLINPEDIDDYQLGYGEFYGHSWVTIPVTDQSGEILFLKLRQDPFIESEGPKYRSTGGEASIFNAQALNDKPEQLIICEGELDCLVLRNLGIAAVSSTAGARTFKEEWVTQLDFVRHIYVCFDNDKAGDEGAAELISKLSSHLPETSILQIKLPEEVGEHGDITTFFKLPTADPSDLFEKYSALKAGPSPIDTANFNEMDVDQLAEVLDLTIKHDKENKLVTFLCMLSAYTDDCQLNVSFNAPSSTGKTYIPTQVAQYFPVADVMEFGGASPTAFYHDGASYDKERRLFVVDLERKIIVFLEQPNPKLQENLRPVLSHDKKEISYKITDKNQKGANRAKHIVIRGYAATIFCSAAMRIDEQEATRAILLSPDTTIEKVREGVHMAALKGADRAAYNSTIDSNDGRRLLKDRILAIKQERVTDIIVPDAPAIETRFLESVKSTKPRHQRDINHLLSLIKCITLLNVWFRRAEDGRITAAQTDVDQGFKIWEKLNESQELNIPPYVFDFYKKYIVSAFQNKNDSRNPDFLAMTGQRGVTRHEISQCYYGLENRILSDDTLRRQVLPMLETAGLIIQEKDPSDKRNKLITPQLFETEEYSGQPGGDDVLGVGHE